MIILLVPGGAGLTAIAWLDRKRVRPNGGLSACEAVAGCRVEEVERIRPIPGYLPTLMRQERSTAVAGRSSGCTDPRPTAARGTPESPLPVFAGLSGEAMGGSCRRTRCRESCRSLPCSPRSFSASVLSGLAATTEEVRELARRALSDPEIQRDLPLAGPGGETERTRGEPPDGAIDSSRPPPRRYSVSARRERRVDDAPGPDRSFRFDMTLEDPGLAMLWAAGIAVLVFMVFKVVRANRARRARSAEPDPEEIPDPTDGGAGTTESRGRNGSALAGPSRIAEADRLAREGEFGEGVRVLLLHAIDHLPGSVQAELVGYIVGDRARHGLGPRAKVATTRSRTTSRCSRRRRYAIAS